MFQRQREPSKTNIRYDTTWQKKRIDVPPHDRDVLINFLNVKIASFCHSGLNVISSRFSIFFFFFFLLEEKTPPPSTYLTWVHFLSSFWCNVVIRLQKFDKSHSANPAAP